MCGQRGEPRVAVTGVAREDDAFLDCLLVPRHVPRLEAEPCEDDGKLVRRGRVVEVPALRVGDPGLIQRVTRGPALRARRVDPDLHVRPPRSRWRRSWRGALRTLWRTPRPGDPRRPRSRRTAGATGRGRSGSATGARSGTPRR